MNILESIYARSAVKYFDDAHQLTKVEEDKLLETTIQAPTRFNVQH